MTLEDDGPYNWTLPATDLYPELKHERCVRYYDGPLSNIFRDADGNGYVLHWGDRSPESERYILLPIPADALSAWIEERAGWRTTFLTAPYAVVVDFLEPMTEGEEGVVKSEKKTLLEVDEYLPLPGDGTCHDYLPDGWLCEHVWWCRTSGWWRGATDEPGNETPCEDEDCYECAPHRNKENK